MDRKSFLNYNLRPPRFSDGQMEQIHLYCFIMNYSFEERKEFEIVNQGKGFIIWNEDKTSHAYLQAGSKDVYAIYENLKTNITECLVFALSIAVKKKENKEVIVNRRMISAARDLFDICIFRINRNKNELRRSKRKNTSGDNSIVSLIKNALQEGTTQNSCILT